LAPGLFSTITVWPVISVSLRAKWLCRRVRAAARRKRHDELDQAGRKLLRDDQGRGQGQARSDGAAQAGGSTVHEMLLWLDGSRERDARFLDDEPAAQLRQGLVVYRFGHAKATFH
jgi:hypothetical protein